MGFIKHALIGIAIYKAVEYLTKKDEFGVSRFEDIKEDLQERVPEWVEKAKTIKEDIQAGKVPDLT
ncbi:YtxH domain-containing protein [Pedobacter sp. GR22-6]|uniref:YtxH domain-containing protein n=1 Tax=Pedobacter sp. GR22-6 TaxID=3127957 RepID=UPI00307FC40A